MIKIRVDNDLHREVKRKLLTPDFTFIEMEKDFGEISLIIFGRHQKRAIVFNCIGPKVPNTIEIKLDKAGLTCS